MNTMSSSNHNHIMSALNGMNGTIANVVAPFQSQSQTPSPCKRTPTPTPIPSRGSTPKFVRFNDEVHTYNTSEDVSCTTSRKQSVTLPPRAIFDEREFDEFKMEKHPISELNELGKWTDTVSKEKETQMSSRSRSGSTSRASTGS